MSKKRKRRRRTPRIVEEESLADRSVDDFIARESYATRPVDVAHHLANVAAELVRLASFDRVSRDVLDAAAEELEQLARELRAGGWVRPELYRDLDVSGRSWFVDPRDLADEPCWTEQAPPPEACVVAGPDGELLD